MTAVVLHPSVEPSQLKRAFGVFPSGVVAVLGDVGNEVTGLAVSAFASVSIEPPMVAIFIRNDSLTWPSLRTAAGLGISVLADGHGDFARQLAGPLEHRLHGAAFVEAEVPLLAGAAARLHVEIESETPAGDHTAVLLRVIQTDVSDAHDPLVFHRSAFATLR